MESERMERTIPIRISQRDSKWPSQPSTSEPSTSLPAMTKKVDAAIRRTVTKDDNLVRTNGPQPPRPPPSPPTSPPLAVSNAFLVNGNGTNDTLSANALSVGSLGYIATLPPREWFQLLVASLPPYAFTATNISRKVLYSRKREVSSKEAERIWKNGVKVVGFDLEWKPMRGWGREYNKVSLVQIATADEILLVQLPESSKFPPGLQSLLEDPSILKVGAGIQNDVDKLKRDWKVSVQNYLDLAFLARYHDYFWDTCDVLKNHCINGAFGGAWCDGIGTDTTSDHASSTPSSDSPDPTDQDGLDFRYEAGLIQEPAEQINVPLEKLHGRPVYPPTQPVALARLVSRYLGRRLDKECQLSNWAAPLSEKQIEYAANDGCSSLDVYNTLIRLRDHTPGWAETQAVFYRMVIEYHHTIAAAASSPVMLEAVTANNLSSSTQEDDEAVFAMEGDETRTTGLAPTEGHATVDGSHHVPNSTPALHRSLSHPHMIKLPGDSPSGEGSGKQKVAGSYPLYPSPPVTPTSASALPAASSVPRSAPASPVLPSRPEPIKSASPGNTVESSGSNETGTIRKGRLRAQKWKSREIYSISHPNSLSYGNKRGESGPESERARRLSETQATPTQQKPVSMPAPIPSNAYHGEYPSIRPPQQSPVRNSATVHAATTSNGYFPPTPATPYSTHHPYDTSRYYATPASYPQPTPVPHAYPYPTPASYAYPVYPTYAQHPYPYPQPQPYYYWSPDAGNHGCWPARNSHSSQTSSSDPPAKRPSLRYSDGGWFNVDTPSAPTSKEEDKRAGGDACVASIPHGIPAPQLDSDVQMEEQRDFSESTPVDASGWVHGDYGRDMTEFNRRESSDTEAQSSSPQMIYVGDVALEPELSSDNVRFNSITGNVSFGRMGNGDDEDTSTLAPEIYA